VSNAVKLLIFGEGYVLLVMLLVSSIMCYFGKEKFLFKMIPVVMGIVLAAWLITIYLAMPVLKWIIGV
jgi:hypothetical protein